MQSHYYHGTSIDNLERILKEGLHGNTDKLWSVSQDEVYLWSPEALSIANSTEDENIEYKEQDAFNRASESGQLALCAANECKVIVIKCLVDSDEVEPDYSCDNMADNGAVTVASVLPENIVSIHCSNDLSLIRWYFMCCLSDKQYCGIEFNETERKLIEKLSKIELYPEDIDSMISWECIYTNRLLLKKA